MMDEQLVEERPALDLRYKHFDHQVSGGIRVIGTWVHLDGRDEPCLVLVGAHQDLRKCVPCVVPLSVAWEWAEETGDEVRTAAKAIDFCTVLPGKSPLHTPDIVSVMDAVRGRLHDLITMPPAPLKERHVAGELIIHTSDERTIRKDIWDDV